MARSCSLTSAPTRLLPRLSVIRRKPSPSDSD
jgi:hypothetical protein